jgi:pSer/pThr/pTyr-binding forkhead associated (FHA) protein
MFKLVISDDEGKTIIVPLVRDLITIGRQDGNTIRLTERNVSRQHAQFVKGEGAVYSVEDLGSYNGVLVNGQRIEKLRDLRDGDRVGIGDYTIAIKADAEAAVPPPQVPRTSAPPGGSPPARLVMISAPAPGAEFSIGKPTVRIGRLEELDLCISHRSISREHARVLQREGQFEVEDLNSANGVRVNGSGTKKATLKSGDIVELGQVRFRFVGPGETYVFDPSEEEQVATPASRPPLGPQRRTVAAIVVTAAVVGGALAFMDDGAATEAGAAAGIVDEASKEAASATPDPEVQRQVDAALEGCRTALAAERFEDAVRSAQNGLALRNDDSSLIECRAGADDALRAQATFEAGKRALAEGKLEEAYTHFVSLPVGHRYRSSPEAGQAAERLGTVRNSEAKKLLRANPAEARRIAQSVVDMQISGLPSSVAEEAQRTIAAADRALASQQPPATSVPPPPARPQQSREPSEAEASASDKEDGAAAKVARNCLARGDQRCAVKALEGNASSAQELALLIETYRALSETKKAVKHMETFVARYPSARQTPQYRQFIAKHEE